MEYFKHRYKKRSPMPKTKIEFSSDSNVAVTDKPEIKEANLEERNTYVPKSKKEQMKEKLKSIMEEELRLVKGRFRNYETPGANAAIYYVKYPDTPPFNQTLVDEKIYEIPLYVARFLNGVDVTAKGCNEKINTCSYPVHGFKWDNGRTTPGSKDDASGNLTPVVAIDKWVRRYGFESLEFDKAI